MPSQIWHAAVAPEAHLLCFPERGARRFRAFGITGIDAPNAETLETLARLGTPNPGLLDFARPRLALARRRRRRPSRTADRDSDAPGRASPCACSNGRTKTERSPLDVLDNPRLTPRQTRRRRLRPLQHGCLQPQRFVGAHRATAQALAADYLGQARYAATAASTTNSASHAPRAANGRSLSSP